MSSKKRYTPVPDNDSSLSSSSSSSNSSSASNSMSGSSMNIDGKRHRMNGFMTFLHWSKKGLWSLWIHFAVMFLKCSIFLSLFNTTRALDNFDATTIALCIAFIDYVIHSIFNHQHLIFNLSAGIVVSFRKWMFDPIDCEPGKPCLDVYGNDTTTRCNRFYTFARDMMNMAALIVGSILAAEFNIRVVFPSKSDDENYKFITHVRDGLSNGDVFGIAVIGFTFLAWMMKQMHYRIKTDIPNCAIDVKCDIDCAISKDQSSLIAAISFVSAFWLFVAIRAPNNVVVMLGASIVSGDYSHLGCLLGAELLVWTLVEFSYFIYARHMYMKRKNHNQLNKHSNSAQMHMSSRSEFEHPRNSGKFTHFDHVYHEKSIAPLGIGNGLRHATE